MAVSKINVVVGDTPQPIPEDIEPEVQPGQVVTPDTGYNTASGDSGVLPWFGVLFFIVVIISAVFAWRRFRGARKGCSDKFRIEARKKNCFAIFAVMVAVCLGGVGVVSLQNVILDTFAADTNRLEIKVSDSVSVNVKPQEGETFAKGYDEVEILSSAKYGYTLYAYALSGQSALKDNSGNLLASIRTEDEPLVLDVNSWGIATSEATDDSSPVWWGISGNQDKPFVVKVTTDDKEKKVRVYYGVNVNTELPEGVYSGNVDYYAIANPAPDDPIDPDEPVGPDDPVGPDEPEEPEEPEDEPVTRTLYFDANGGHNEPGRKSCVSQTADVNCAIILPSTIPDRGGYAFLGWSESKTAATPEYQASGTILLSSDLKLFAVWERRINVTTYVVGDGGTISDSLTNIPSGESFTVSFTPNNNYEIDYVTVNDSVVTVSGNQLTLTAGDDDLVIAVAYKKMDEPVVASRILSFNANGGAGVPGKVKCQYTEPETQCSVSIPETAPTRSNYYFLGYSNTPSGTVASFQPGGSLTLASDLTLYAIWAPVYRLRLNNNDGVSSTTTVDTCHPMATTGECVVSIPLDVPVYEKHSFKGWATSKTAETADYAVGKSISISANTILYGVWQSEKVAVHFINTGGSGNATLLENKGLYAIVDTGQTENYPSVKSYLDSLGVKRLEFIIVSHPHYDHNGNVVNLLNDYEVGTIYEKTYTNKDTYADGNTLIRYNRITEKAAEKNVPIVYVDKTSKFKEAVGKSGVINLNGTMKIHFFNTAQRLDHEKTSGETFDYFSSGYWAGKGENLNSIVNLIRVNGHNVLLTGDLNNYDILKYMMDEKVDIAYKNGQTLDVYSIPHHANYNCTGNKPMSVVSSYFIATNFVNSKFDTGEYRITNSVVNYPNGNVYTSCFKNMGMNYKNAYYSVNDKADSPATVFDLTDADIELTGGYKGKVLTDGHE